MPARATAKATKTVKSSMSDQHKQALAIGREESRAVRRYLDALEANKPKRGRKRTPDGIARRLRQIEERLESADPLTRVNLLQEKMNLEEELAAKQDGVDIAALEEGFIAAAKGYSERKGITWSAWRAAGVEASVLTRAGIPRTRS